MKKIKTKIRLGVLGISGKMGRKIQEIVDSDSELGDRFQIVFAASGPQDPRFKTFSKQKCQVVVDFSAPTATLAMAEECAKNRVPMVVCTTGFSTEELTSLKKKLKSLAWVISPNTSYGVYVLKKITEMASKLLKPELFECEIIEAHHKFKKDAPSGTALSLAESLRRGHSGREVIPFHSIRGGTEIGEHEILMLGNSERLSLGHRATDRGLFALGALKLAETIIKLRPRSKPYSSDEIFDKSL